MTKDSFYFKVQYLYGSYSLPGNKNMDKMALNKARN